MALLELFNTDKYLNNLINYGIEGTHYVKVSDNVIKAGPAVDQYNLGMQYSPRRLFGGCDDVRAFR